MRFYAYLFSPETIAESCKQTLLNGLSKTLSVDDRELCEGVPSLAELADSVKGLARSKSPGADGFSAEFYCRFWAT